MSKRLSQAPRLSVIMAGDEVIERKTSVKEFLCNHVKTIATLVMIFATILCIVLIVMGEWSGLRVPRLGPGSQGAGWAGRRFLHALSGPR